MLQLNSLLSKINSINESTFEATSIEVFNYQAKYNSVFQKYLQSLGHPCHAQGMADLVFLPIEFFKNHTIKTQNWEEETVFESSGTTGNQTSRHYIKDLSLYHQGCTKHFEMLYGDLSEYSILALLPSYLERGNSGLIAMVNAFMNRTQKASSGYFLNDIDHLISKLKEYNDLGKKTILWGVTFALLDLADQFVLDFPELIIIETGGMKGRRKELVRQEVHQVLKNAFNVRQVHSEYGMTELNSQAYALKNGVFQPAPTMSAMIRDINDPFANVSDGRTGALNIIDLGNIHTCSFIETKDLGRRFPNGFFEVLGRMDNADIRGCNLLIS